MSRTLQISLMVLTAMLCGVCVWQWQRESRAAAAYFSLRDELAAARSQTGAQTVKLAEWEKEIARLNEALATQSESITKLPEIEARATAATQQFEAAQAVFTQQQAAFETLKTQLQKALDERDALATQLNTRTREFNALAEKYRKAR